MRGGAEAHQPEPYHKAAQLGLGSGEASCQLTLLLAHVKHPLVQRAMSLLIPGQHESWLWILVSPKCPAMVNFKNKLLMVHDRGNETQGLV